MNQDADRLHAIARACLDILPIALPQTPPTDRSLRTEADYLRTTEVLMARADGIPGALAKAVQATQSPRTFHKRIAALRFACRQLVRQHLDIRSQERDIDWHKLATVLPQLHDMLRALVTLSEEGMTQPRRKRRSKRQVLKGLPPSWREQLCARGSTGKYADALLASALTGARPGELVRGITTWLQLDEELGIPTLRFHVHGLKVKERQGQRFRFMAFATEDPHPLVASMVKRLNTLPGKRLEVHVTKPGNFTAEVQRLARALWPKHGHAITATCFRHQWSADVKASGDGDATSRGLGHRSAKTRRHYGMAHQARGGHALRPVRIEADLPVRTFRPNLYPGTPALRIE